MLRLRTDAAGAAENLVQGDYNSQPLLSCISTHPSTRCVCGKCFVFKLQLRVRSEVSVMGVYSESFREYKVFQSPMAGFYNCQKLGHLDKNYPMRCFTGHVEWRPSGGQQGGRQRNGGYIVAGDKRVIGHDNLLAFITPNEIRPNI
ncbi:Hypothetical protein CINCED_3A022438 [Cinara cedri]|uniref:Uncharacterized protein n=1 Tax=Cinara cedri TaxID=506608 RepID=A0A5E4NSM5_9HEMI|nr:Hypothetical protein CINCED_3A022438 [Cinara cedri]